jgi:D-arabinose 1-dehydrogenase-like Zn-dependent alcohol dehydrogenase
MVEPGETVLVLAAAGGVGLAAVEIARHLKARVWVILLRAEVRQIRRPSSARCWSRIRQNVCACKQPRSILLFIYGLV